MELVRRNEHYIWSEIFIMCIFFSLSLSPFLSQQTSRFLTSDLPRAITSDWFLKENKKSNKNLSYPDSFPCVRTSLWVDDSWKNENFQVIKIFFRLFLREHMTIFPLRLVFVYVPIFFCCFQLLFIHLLYSNRYIDQTLFVWILGRNKL
jgi:hypothetical protein